MQCSRSAAGAAAVRLAVLLDLLYFTPGADAVLSIEPACLVMVRAPAAPRPLPPAPRTRPSRAPCHACRLRRLPGGAGAGRQISACPKRASSNKKVLVCASSAHLVETKAHSVWCRAARAPRRPTERPLRRSAPSQSTRT